MTKTSTFFREAAHIGGEISGWRPIVIPKAAIDAEIGRLASLDIPAGGRRQSRISHPDASAPGYGLAPGIDVTINVVRPNEETVAVRRNSSQLSICIQGEGVAVVGRQTFGLRPHDVWTTPSMQAHRYRNTGSELFVLLSYSNAPLLEMMRVHFAENLPSGQAAAAEPATRTEAFKKAKALAETFEIGGDGAYLMSYEHLIDPDVVANPPLKWDWRQVEQYLGKLTPLGLEYTGRRLFALYNPATGRTNGTTHSFFATMGVLPPGSKDMQHRHSSASINYYIQGEGFSDVGDQHLTWSAGDIMLSAPGWAPHGHGSATGAVALTVQDHPLQIAMESLIWQEGLDQPVVVLGAQEGFSTNLAEFARAD